MIPALLTISCGCTGPAARTSVLPSPPPPLQERDPWVREATTAAVAGQYVRLPDDVTRAAQRLGWAALPWQVPSEMAQASRAWHRALRLHEGDALAATKAAEPPGSAGAIPPARQGALAMRGVLLQPSGRRVEVVAWPLGTHGGQERIGVAIRAGHFGNPQDEQALLQALAQVLAAKPTPRRGGEFHLPETW